MPSARSRYDTLLKLASGGMATVWIGQVRGALGFRQLVAIKKPHPHLLDDPGFRTELVAEARLASLIHHANVVDVRDIEVDQESISLIMDYIEGASLGDLLVIADRQGSRLPPAVTVRIVLDACAGLHAAHELVDERGRAVGLVHRDVSPQNILVGSDGISRVADFGVAKFARKNLQSTSEGSLKGKLAYMPPEYVKGESIDRRFDVFATGVVLWEALVGKRCFRGDNEAETLHRILTLEPTAPSKLVPDLPTDLDDVIMTALAKRREERFQNAAAMAAALEACALAARILAGHTEVARTVKSMVGTAIEERRSLVRAKLANEPSVGSLLDVPPIVPAVPTTVPNTSKTDVDARTAAVTPKMATPKMGGAGNPATLAATALDTRPHVATQLSAGVVASPATPQWVDPALSNTALAPTYAPYTLRSEGAETELSFHEPSAPIEMPLPSSQRPWWFVPSIMAASVASVIGGVMAVRLRAQAPPTSQAAPPTTEHAVRVPDAGAIASVVPTNAPSLTVPTARPEPPPTSARPSRSARPTTTKSASPPAAASAPASPPPPPNPYATPGEAR
jgi:eukaryotic-like serine/threonine-protein kinase